MMEIDTTGVRRHSRRSRSCAGWKSEGTRAALSGNQDLDAFDENVSDEDLIWIKQMGAGYLFRPETVAPRWRIFWPLSSGWKQRA
jgi:hypothetical protein